uniref:Serine/threonine-protein kinase Sgk1 n=1 Tax=Sander lucioperca TaxID=283035 RepID=A0A8C9YPQ3_SANLU
PYLFVLQLRSPSSSPRDDVNLGPSANPNARPTDFDFLAVIGKGTFGKVLLAKLKADNKFYAVKVLQKKVILKKKEQKNIMAERNVLLKSLKHPFLVRLHYSFQTPEKLYFVLDYVNGGELFFHLQRERCFSEPRARFYSAEVASAIGYLHSLNIVYRDLKPENILLDSQGHVVLTDFGLCKEGVEPEGTTSTFCGTPEYLAPEVLRKEAYDRTVDWWCLGAVTYEMIYSLPPFYSRDVAEMYDGILHKPLPLPPGKSDAVCSLLVGLLQKDQHRRLGAIADFLEIKNHIFFSPINWDDLDHKRITPPYNPNVVSFILFTHILIQANFFDFWTLVRFFKNHLISSLTSYDVCHTGPIEAWLRFEHPLQCFAFNCLSIALFDIL